MPASGLSLREHRASWRLGPSELSLFPIPPTRFRAPAFTQCACRHSAGTRRWVARHFPLALIWSLRLLLIYTRLVRHTTVYSVHCRRRRTDLHPRRYQSIPRPSPKPQRLSTQDDILCLPQLHQLRPNHRSVTIIHIDPVSNMSRFKQDWYVAGNEIADHTYVLTVLSRATWLRYVSF